MDAKFEAWVSIERPLIDDSFQFSEDMLKNQCKIRDDMDLKSQEEFVVHRYFVRDDWCVFYGYDFGILLLPYGIK